MRNVLSVGTIALVASIATLSGSAAQAQTPAPRPAIVSVSNPAGVIPPTYSHQLLCSIRRSDNIDRMLNEIVDQTLSMVRTINKEDVAVTLIELCAADGCGPALGHVHGEEMLYPSGLARLPYAAAVYSARNGKLSNAMEADVKASLRDGNNAATNNLVDYLRAKKGSEGANKFLAAIGMENFNVNQHFITGDPDGADADSLGRKLTLNYENSNRMTSNQAAGLFYLLAKCALVSPAASQAMKAYMHHPLEQKKVGELAGIAAGLPVGAEIVTLNGFTVRNYNEVALITLPNGRAYVLSVMTKYNGYPTPFISLLSRTIAFRMMTTTGDEDPALHTYIPALAR